MDEAAFGLETARVAIVGLGLMGASLAMDLRGHCGEIIGISRSPETLKYALDNRIVDRIASFDPHLDCELMVLAAPVRTIIRQLKELGDSSPHATSERTVILDLGSTKTEIVKAMQALPDQFDPIGGHPMCGKEVAGIRNAESNLYRNKMFVITPLERTSSAALEMVSEMVKVIGAAPLSLTPQRQDGLVALTSHVPYLVASALMQTALTKEDPELWKVAASGFRDTSRLAASDLTMMIDILLTNQEAILEALKEYQAELEILKVMVKEGNETKLREVLTPIQQKRAALFSQENR